MRKIYYYAKLKTLSPLNIGNGKSDHTDMDVLKDEQGHFFIPGTSIAGACLHDLNEEYTKLFNPKLGEQYKISPVFFSDAYMLDSEKVQYEVRDGIQVDSKKIAVDKSKFNYEVVPANTCFMLRIEVTDRYNDSKYQIMIENLLSHIKNQDIKLGTKTTRGLGSITIEECGKKVFNIDNFESEYFSFDSGNMDHYDVLELEELLSDKYVTIKAELKQKGGISIRTYNTVIDEADYKHIHSNGKPIIPASSWNGLIRKEFAKYAELLGLSELTDAVFGFVRGDKKQKSKIHIEESILSNGHEVELFRNSINRFHAKTMNTGLFREKSYYDGDTTLVIKIDKEINNLDVVVKIIKYILEDINDGIIALGGLTAIGRGIFKVNLVSITGMEGQCNGK